MATLLRDLKRHFSPTTFFFGRIKITGLMVCFWIPLLAGCVSHPFAHLEEWEEVRTRHFIFYSNAEEQVTLEIASNLENFREIALKMITIPEFQDSHSLRVYVFKDSRSFKPFQPTEHVGGFFIPGPNYIAINAGEWNLSASSIIYHEYIHYLISKHPAHFPRWYDEGLAELFETLEYQDEMVKFGIPPSDMLFWLNMQAEWIPMDQLLLDQVDFTDNQGLTHAHSQSWAIMHYFLLGKEENFFKLGRYIFLVNNGTHPHEALMEACGLTPRWVIEGD